MSMADSDAADVFFKGLATSFGVNKQKSIEKAKEEKERVREQKMKELEYTGLKLTKEKIANLDAQVAKAIPKEERNVFN